MPSLSITQTTIPGVGFASTACGIKKRRPDLGLIAFPEGTRAAAMFTQNALAAAPVHVSRQHVGDGNIRALFVNSGNANACTGRQGLRDALEMSQLAADALDIDPEEVLVASTGVIGQPLEMDKIRQGISNLQPDRNGMAAFANAILTTDSGPKVVEHTFELDGQTYSMIGITKGAGMIHPNMATMLSFVITDAPVSKQALDASLRTSVQATYNQISIDGDESTNDMVAAFATNPDNHIDEFSPTFPDFEAAMQDVCAQASRQIVGDGEGATRGFEVQVVGAPSPEIARSVSRAIASSTLVKSAVHGADANWGRIGAAAGAAWRAMPTDWSMTMSTDLQSMEVMTKGEPQELPQHASDILRAPWLTIRLLVGDGPSDASAWGCDLTPEYVAFNAAYRT